MKLKLTAILAAMCIGLSGLGTAHAAPAGVKVVPGAVPAAHNNVVKIGHRNRGRVHVGIHWYGGHVYFNGHRGYRHHKRGYRKHRGYWFPHRAFIVVYPRHRHVYFPRYRAPQPVKPRIIRLSHAHVRWCDAKYRSYRHSDNTFQPYHGPRKQCVSPYY